MSLEITGKDIEVVETRLEKRALMASIEFDKLDDYDLAVVKLLAFYKSSKERLRR